MGGERTGGTEKEGRGREGKGGREKGRRGEGEGPLTQIPGSTPGRTAHTTCAHHLCLEKSLPVYTTT